MRLRNLLMAVVVDTLANDPRRKSADGEAPRPRHPEKAHRPDQPILRKPDWIRVKAPGSPLYAETRAIVKEHKLVTVCEEAGCPNIGECWEKKHATFMIMGDTCTRACAFCNVRTGLPEALDASEPEHVADAVAKLGLSHVVITSVDRDDLADGGAKHFARTIEEIRRLSPKTTIEILTPDFLRKEGALEIVVAARPDVFNHNLETVPRLYKKVRPGSDYQGSLDLLQQYHQILPQVPTKSGLMLGVGELQHEVHQVMKDLVAHGCSMLTLGQYLQPSKAHLPVESYVTPEQFEEYGVVAKALGFKQVASAPMVRSSYHADLQAKGLM